MKYFTYYNPVYKDSISEWEKYRLTYKGGRQFIDAYLEKFSKQEDNDDFAQRKKLAYSPAYAKAAINEIINGIFQRVVDVSRKGGDITYQKAVEGEGKGVDLKGGSMRSFLGRKVLPELLPIGKVGIFIDRNKIPENATIDATKNITPYMYIFRAEDICHWSEDEEGKLTKILLKKNTPKEYSNTTFDDGYSTSMIEMELIPQGGVSYKEITHDENGEEVVSREETLKLKSIPFIVADLRASLLEDVADYQIALLNISSSDLNYALKSNFPFYTEQQSNTVPNAIKGIEAKTVKTGPVQGRAYAKDHERPGFINPSSDPLKVSMEKQEQMKKEIRELVNLAVENLGQDKGLEAGLSYIGLELERVEREIAKIWAEYMGWNEPVTIAYPNTYDLETDEERYSKADQLLKMRKEVPSLIYKKEITKRVAAITLNKSINVDLLNDVFREIDEAEVIVVDPDSLIAQHEAGLVSDELASRASGFPKGEHIKAQADKEKRMEHMLQAQTAFGKRGQDNVTKNPPARGAGQNTFPEANQAAKMEKKIARETN